MGDSVKFTATARSLGIISAAVTVILVVAYAVTLTMGLLFLKSPQQPIGDPMFTSLEVLIILMMAAMVALMVAVHAWAPMHAKTLSWIPPARSQTPRPKRAAHIPDLTDGLAAPP